ncbi:MAG: adenosylmethionine decarboxylase [Elusimicrobia bacterium]|nr:adenosylmethionine decarboxylase [Elusimicrobiota bacterium]
MFKTFGQHYLVEYIGCEADRIAFVGPVREALLRAAEESRATILETFFHQFEPKGVSGMLFIAESHFSIHTWPEDGYAAFDVLTCGRMEPEKAVESLRKSLGARDVRCRVVSRGYGPEGGSA